jgi:hypothetical protein
VLDYQWFKGVLVGYGLVPNPSKSIPAFSSCWQTGLVLNYHWRTNQEFTFTGLYQYKQFALNPQTQLRRNMVVADVQYSYPLFIYNKGCKAPFWLNIAAFGAYSFSDRLDNPEYVSWELSELQKIDVGGRIGFSLSLANFEPSIGYEQGFLSRLPNQKMLFNRQFYLTLKFMYGK